MKEGFKDEEGKINYGLGLDHADLVGHYQELQNRFEDNLSLIRDYGYQKTDLTKAMFFEEEIDYFGWLLATTKDSLYWIRRNAMVDLLATKNPKALPKLRMEHYHEGQSVQILHQGSYDDEAPTIAKLHNEFMPDNNLTEAGKHHEIYLSDPRRVAPEKLKTILGSLVGA